jgi:signal transduction histidine kinase
VSSRRTDAWIGLAAIAFGLGTAPLDHAYAFSYVAGAIIGGAFGAGRRHPRGAWLLTAAAVLAATPFGPLPTGMTFVAVAQAFWTGRHDRGWWAVGGLVALVAALEINLVGTDSFVPALILPAAAWGAGRALGERELVAKQLAQRARELEEEREAHAALSVRYERARIASELHDIVAHAISVMVVQASAGQRLAHDPEATAETFEAIAGAARQAERDMGRLVALLGDKKAIGPAPDLALVEELVARAAGSGLDVMLRLEGEREGLPAEVGEAAYRVVQEGLTNALRYAAGATVAVRVRAAREDLTVEVENDATDRQPALAGAGTGNGLRGLRERVDACGGRLEAGPTARDGWLLSARLPRRIGAVAGHPTG